MCMTTDATLTRRIKKPSSVVGLERSEFGSDDDESGVRDRRCSLRLRGSRCDGLDCRSTVLED